MNEQISFSEIERLSKIAIETGDLNKLQGILTPLLQEEDRTRSASENLFLYRSLGSLYTERDEKDEALEAYRRAFSHDARDLETLTVLAENELKKDASEADASLLMDLLFFHRHELKNHMTMRIFKHIGDAHNAKNELNEARDCYEKALEARPGDMELINALLKASEATGDEKAIAKSREKLLSSMTSAESRAAVLVSIGDDYLNRKNDEKMALSMYEEALAECAQSTAAHLHILLIAEKAEDWDRCLNTLNSLLKYSTDKDEKCKYLLKMAWIFKEKLNNPKKAVQYFNDILDIDPDQVEVFKQVIATLNGMNDMAGIEANYARMVERQRALTPVNAKLVGGLCQKLGEIRARLNDLKGAIEAYKIITELFPDKVEFHEKLATLYAMSDDMLEEAIHENREVLRLAPDHLKSVSALAKCYRRLGQYDEALCIYRVLDVLKLNDDEGKVIVAKFADMDMPKISELLTEEMWKLIIPKTLDGNIVKIFRICVPIIGRLFANDLRNYQLSEKDDRIDTSEGSVFANTVRNETQALGFKEVPAIYKSPRFRGVYTAYLSSRSLLVHPNFLQGRSEREIAFTTAKSLLMLRSEYYLLRLGAQGVQCANYIKRILEAVFKTIDPSLNINLAKEQVVIAKDLNEKLSDADRRTLKTIVDDVKDVSKINLSLFIESVEDFCNRIGLLFCDDPSIISKMLLEEARTISARAAQDRVGSLLVWALSEEYTKLRKLLGINLQA